MVAKGQQIVVKSKQSKPANTPRSSSSSQPPFGIPPYRHLYSLAYDPHTKVIHLVPACNLLCTYRLVPRKKCCCEKMDDPDVDHDLIAFMRESLGISSKAQDVVTSDTGKAGLFFLLFSCIAKYHLDCESTVYRCLDIHAAAAA
jgi:hypothetical protein